MHTLLYSVPPTLQQATTNPHLHQGLLDTHRQVGSVSCGVIAPLSWVLVHTSFCLCPVKVCFPSPCKFWRLFGGVNGDLLQEGLRHTQDCCTQSPCPCRRPLLTCTFTGETQTQLGSVSVGSLGPGVHKVCLSLLSVSGGYGV